MKVYAEAHCVKSWYDVYVDGVKVKTLVMDRGESRYPLSFSLTTVTKLKDEKQHGCTGPPTMIVMETDHHRIIEYSQSYNQWRVREGRRIT